MPDSTMSELYNLLFPAGEFSLTLYYKNNYQYSALMSIRSKQVLCTSKRNPIHTQVIMVAYVVLHMPLQLQDRTFSQ